jgi:hypothetical protein
MDLIEIFCIPNKIVSNQVDFFLCYNTIRLSYKVSPYEIFAVLS